MKLTNPEKLILSMLASLHERLEIETETAKLISDAIYTGNTWALSWELTGIVGDNADPNPPAVTEVANYLDMWSFLEEGVAALSPEVRAELDAAVLGAKSFPGFDGNDESEHYSIAGFLVGPLKRFARFADRDLNSHHPTLYRYEAMYAVFEPMRKRLGLGRPLTQGELSEILSA
ncbi:YfbU family protein [Alicycliphilus denitrificans]|uniref:YfbU family protein n=1 Tax=Alicycliphilus denitrificans TaxID=179636 RepID=UPI0038506851